LDKLSAGNYSLTITDIFGCKASSNAIITQPLPLNLAVTKIVNATGTSSNGSIDITVSGGTKPYTFAWKKEGINLISTTEDLTNLKAGNYELLVTDANKCIIQSEKIVLQSVIAVNDVKGLIEFKTFPNPTDKIFNISLQLSDNQVIKSSLIDILGRVVMEKNAVNTAFYQEQFDLTNLPNASYWLRVEVGTQQIIEKIIKN
jgi:hypothetical protein